MHACILKLQSVLLFYSSTLSDYPSFLRPKGIPEVDYFTLLGCRLVWTFMGFARRFKMFAFIFIKLRIMHLVNWIFLALQVRTKSVHIFGAYQTRQLQNTYREESPE